jgi:SNF2 family DNA or RNA helicase
MKLRILIICPQAVGPAWLRQFVLHNSGQVTPWRHQLDAAAWFADRQYGLLAGDMGTGKSLTACMIAAGTEQIVPLLLTTGTGKARAKALATRLAAATGESLAVIINYDSVWRPEVAAVLNRVKWDAIITDESHRIKSPTGRASKWIAGLARANPQAKRLALTGTPMPHSPLDLWAQFRFLNPDIFGQSFVAFRARYAICDRMFPSKVIRWVRQDELTAKLDANAWRVKADDVLDLPDAMHETIAVELEPAARKFYDALARDMAAELETGVVTAANALTRLLRLHMATSGYTRLDSPDGIQPRSLLRLTAHPAKQAALADWLTDLPHNEPVVVFARFRCDLIEIAAVAKALGRPYSELSGEANGLAEWQDGKTTVLGVQLQSGGVGIDLTRAAFAAYYSMGFNLGDYTQSLARLRRPGQTRCVRYYHLVASNTIDEQIYKALSDRSDVVESVLTKLSPRQEAFA